MSRRGKARREARTPPRLARAAAPAALVVLVVLAYAPALDNGFVYWDDQNYVSRSAMVDPGQTSLADVFTHSTLKNYHPLTILTWRWNAEPCADCAFGYPPRAFVAWNLVLHALNSLLVFLLTWRLSGRNAFVGLFSATVFALHPMHVESVAWISQRKDVLSAFFLLAALIAHDRFLEERYAAPRRAGLGWLGATLGLFLMACLSKPTGVMFPLLMLLLDFWRNPEGTPLEALRATLAPRKLAEAAPFFALSLLFGLVALDLSGGGDFHGLLPEAGGDPNPSALRGFTALQRAHFASYGFVTYLVKLVAPVNLSPWYAYPVEQDYHRSSVYGWTLVIAIGLLAVTAWSLGRGRLLAFGVGFYAIAVAPVLQVVAVGWALMADRYTYLPYIGPAFVIGTWLSRWAGERPRRRWPRVHALTAVVAVAWVAQTRQQVDVWHDSEALWTRVIELYPDEVLPYTSRGNYYLWMAEYWRRAGDVDRHQHYQRKAEADWVSFQEKRALYE